MLRGCSSAEYALRRRSIVLRGGTCLGLPFSFLMLNAPLLQGIHHVGEGATMPAQGVFHALWYFGVDLAVHNAIRFELAKLHGEGLRGDFRQSGLNI